MTGPAPGWYQDPFDPGVLRYYDGDHWTQYSARRGGGSGSVKVIGIVLAAVGGGAFLLVSLLVVLVLVFLALAPGGSIGTGGRVEKPWYGGGVVEVSGAMCSTAGLGRFDGHWAMLTAAHCSTGRTGVPVLDASGSVVGTVVWADEVADLAIIALDRDLDVSAEDARAWTGSWETYSSVGVGGTAEVPKEGSAGIWTSGGRLGAVGGGSVTVLGSTLSDSQAGTLETYIRVGVPEGRRDRVAIAAPGQSGSGAYVVRDGKWMLWGVLVAMPVSDGTDVSCATLDGVSNECSFEGFVVPIGPALEAGFEVAAFPH